MHHLQLPLSDMHLQHPLWVPKMVFRRVESHFDSFWVCSLPFEIFFNFGHHLVNSWISSNCLFFANPMDDPYEYSKLSPKRSREAKTDQRTEKVKKEGKRTGPKAKPKNEAKKEGKRVGLKTRLKRKAKERAQERG